MDDPKGRGGGLVEKGSWRRDGDRVTSTGVWVVSAFLLASNIAGAAPTPLIEVPALPFEKYQLSNGLTVLLHEDHRLPLVTVSVRYEVGSLHEREGRSGFAHLFEHMMFQGSAHLAEDEFFELMHSRGASDVNGATSFDFTQYYETMPRHELEVALWAESDRMGSLLSAVNQASLDNQKQVVRNERRQRTEDRPYGLVDLLIFQHLYPKTHPYHDEVIGRPQDLEAASLEDVRDFFRTYYTPRNASLCLAGDFDPLEAKALIQKYFASIFGTPRPEPPPVLATFGQEEKRLTVLEPIAARSRLTIVWPGPDQGSPGAAELDTLAALLEHPEDNLLGGHLWSYNVRAYDLSASFEENVAGSRFRVDVSVDPGVDLGELLLYVDRLFELLRRLPLDDRAILAAAKDRERDVIFALESLRVRAQVIQQLNAQFGDPGHLQQYLSRYRRVTSRGVQEATRRFLGPRRLIVFAKPAGRQLGRKRS